MTATGPSAQPAVGNAPGQPGSGPTSSTPSGTIMCSPIDVPSVAASIMAAQSVSSHRSHRFLKILLKHSCQMPDNVVDVSNLGRWRPCGPFRSLVISKFQHDHLSFMLHWKSSGPATGVPPSAAPGPSAAGTPSRGMVVCSSL